jgi:hypothetical protein
MIVIEGHKIKYSGWLLHELFAANWFRNCRKEKASAVYKPAETTE